MKAQMARIIKEYLQAVEKAANDYKEAISNAGTADWIHSAARAHQDAVAAAGREAIEKTQKLLEVNHA